MMLLQQTIKFKAALLYDSLILSLHKSKQPVDLREPPRG